LAANAGCTKHICGVGQGAVASVSTAARVRVPRRALEIQPCRGVGQDWDSKRRDRPFRVDVLLGAGEARKVVSVMARLDGRAADA